MIKYPPGQGPRRGKTNVHNIQPNLQIQASDSILPKNFAKHGKLDQGRKRPIHYGSRGMSLEEQINQSNIYYLNKNLAVIHKKPTPIQVVKVDYPRRSAAKITEAYYRQASTTDYNGVYQGKYIDFEAKETRNRTSFPLSNLKSHQLDHMHTCHEQGGWVFLLIGFTAHQTVYLLPYPKLARFLNDHSQQSIPYDYIQKEAYLCPQAYQPMIDYLYALDSYLARENPLE